MNIELTDQKTRQEVFEKIENYLTAQKLNIASKDFERPWGGFFVIDENQAEQFCKLFFPGIKVADLHISGKLSPKILVVQPGKRLSWQYHHRRAEIWKLIAGAADVVTGTIEKEEPVKTLALEEVIRLSQGQCHRLVGSHNWGVVAEIWQHTDSEKPSDEDDIIRLQDDFGR